MSAWTVIAHTEVGSGGVSNIEFTSIPQTYTDLLVLYSLRESPANIIANTFFTINGTSTNYSERMLRGLSGVAAGFSQSSSSIQWIYIPGSSATSNTFGNARVYIPNYTEATAKSISIDVVTEDNSADSTVVINAALWNNTAAITSLKIAPSSSNIVQYSSATLYGITKGSSGGVSVS